MKELNFKRQKSNSKESIGFTSFFAEYDSDIQIDYDHFILDYNSFKKYPNYIKRMRNLLIKLTFLQIISSILSMLFIIFRRSFVYLFISLITLVLAISGVYGSLQMHLVYLLIHCVLTISITGGFIIYQIVDLLFGTDTAYGNKERMNDNVILLIFTLPFIFDFGVGVYNYYMMKKISVYNEEKKKLNHSPDHENRFEVKKISEEQVDKFISGVDHRICIICMDRNRDVVLNPCGHVLCCSECAGTIFTQNFIYEIKCPICRRKCSSYVKMLIS
jgi:hypothetical protein